MQFIFFELAGQTYSVKLLDVREIVKPLPITPIPNTVPCLLGLVNLRGEVISVVDLRLRFSADAPQLETNVLLVFVTDYGPVATLVDRVIAVKEIPETQLEPTPHTISLIDIEFVTGVLRLEESLVPLIDLRRILAAEEWIKAAELAKKAS